VPSHALNPSKVISILILMPLKHSIYHSCFVQPRARIFVVQFKASGLVTKGGNLREVIEGDLTNPQLKVDALLVIPSARAGHPTPGPTCAAGSDRIGEKLIFLDEPKNFLSTLKRQY
jgi:hypothetical protein